MFTAKDIVEFEVAVQTAVVKMIKKGVPEGPRGLAAAEMLMAGSFAHHLQASQYHIESSEQGGVELDPLAQELANLIIEAQPELTVELGKVTLSSVSGGAPTTPAERKNVQ